MNGGVPVPAGFQHACKFPGRDRSAEQITLTLFTTLFLEKGELAPRFDPFGHYPLLPNAIMALTMVASSLPPLMPCMNDWSILSVSMGKRRR